MSISFIIAIMRQRRYLQNLVHSTHSHVQTECKMSWSGQKKKWCFGKRQRQTNVAQTYFFIIFDLIFCDDTVGLLGLLPGEVDAVLLHSLFDDLADLGWSCLEKSMSISAGQTLSACTGIRPAANEPHQLLHQHSQALCT